MIPELLTIAKYATLVGGGWIAKALLTKWLGKTKEEAEIVLNWEKIHAERDRKLLGEIKRLEDKVDEFINAITTMKENHRQEVLKWESIQDKHLSIIKEKDGVISKQYKEIEELKSTENENNN